MTPRFYFTTHQGDMMRGRLLKGCHIMLVASAHWHPKTRRFRIARPPADHVSSVCIDSGGFTAARRWGEYPWTPAEYAQFIRDESRDVTLDFCAIMDYACEPSVNRETYETNRQRIRATIENEQRCQDAAPDLPWLPVLQGDSLDERAFDLELRDKLGLLPTDYAGIGSVCGRGSSAAVEVIRFYRRHLPGVQYHGFGLHIQALDQDDVYFTVRSWDSYGWTWGRGQKNKDRPPEYLKKPGATYSQHIKNLARLYWANTIKPRLSKQRQLPLLYT